MMYSFHSCRGYSCQLYFLTILNFLDLGLILLYPGFGVIIDFRVVVIRPEFVSFEKDMVVLIESDQLNLSALCNQSESIMAVRMSEKNTAALKEALSAQQKLLQKLYNELDVEREASSTVASEALSMILRLQGEKAAMKMEAEQYKKFAEEKMCYAEESMEIFEELVYQKEMEVTALDYQVQSYRYKLQSLGYNDPGVGEIKFPENLLQKSETLIGETSAQSISGRKFCSSSSAQVSTFKKKR